MELSLPIRNDDPRTPRVRGLPLLGSAPEFQRDPYAFFVQKHLELGPVFHCPDPFPAPKELDVRCARRGG